MVSAAIVATVMVAQAMLAQAIITAFGVAPARAATVMQQCGELYQAAKAAGTLNGRTWLQFRTECALRLKGDAAAGQTTATATVPASPAGAGAADADAHPGTTPAVVPAPAAEAGTGTTPSAAGDRQTQSAQPPTATPPPSPAAALPPAGQSTAPPAAADATAGTAPDAKPRAPSPKMQAMFERERRCAAEWHAHKADLVAATPGLAWPRFWSQCNARLKAATP